MCNVKVDLQYYYVCTIKRGNSYIEDDLYTQGKFSLRFAEGLIIFSNLLSVLYQEHFCLKQKSVIQNECETIIFISFPLKLL